MSAPRGALRFVRAYYAAFFARRGHPPAERQRAGSQPKPRTARLGFDDSPTLRRPAARDARQTPLSRHPIASAIFSTPPPPHLRSALEPESGTSSPPQRAKGNRSVNSVEIEHSHRSEGGKIYHVQQNGNLRMTRARRLPATRALKGSPCSNCSTSASPTPRPASRRRPSTTCRWPSATTSSWRCSVPRGRARPPCSTSSAASTTTTRATLSSTASPPSSTKTRTGTPTATTASASCSKATTSSPTKRCWPTWSWRSRYPACRAPSGASAPCGRSSAWASAST